MESSDRLTSYITPEGYVWDVGLSPWPPWTWDHALYNLGGTIAIGFQRTQYVTNTVGQVVVFSPISSLFSSALGTWPAQPTFSPDSDHLFYQSQIAPGILSQTLTSHHPKGVGATLAHLTSIFIFFPLSLLVHSGPIWAAGDPSPVSQLRNLPAYWLGLSWATGT